MTTPLQSRATRGIRGPGVPLAVCVTDRYGNIIYEKRAQFATPSAAVAAVAGSGIIPVGANPSATAGPAAVNGTAATFMRSDGAPAVQLCTASQKGIAQADGTTITVASGVISALAQCHVYAPCTVSALPTGAQGDRGFVTDSTTTLALGLGIAPTGGGTNETPVWKSSTSWLIG